jgi:hypothetical protein
MPRITACCISSGPIWNQMSASELFRHFQPGTKVSSIAPYCSDYLASAIVAETPPPGSPDCLPKHRSTMYACALLCFHFYYGGMESTRIATATGEQHSKLSKMLARGHHQLTYHQQISRKDSGSVRKECLLRVTLTACRQPCLLKVHMIIIRQ